MLTCYQKGTKSPSYFELSQTVEVKEGKINEENPSLVVKSFQDASKIIQTNVQPKQAAFNYAEALLGDADTIDALMSTEGIYDSNKIVILPHKFRKESIETAIKSGRYFVARNDEKVIGYKKLFVMENADEQNEVLTKEIRCLSGTLIDTYSLSGMEKAELCRKQIFDPEPYIFKDNDVYIYDGADFTSNDFRGQGVNKKLTDRAFDLIKDNTRRLILEKQSERIILLYGLTYLNDYGLYGEGKSRTPSILDSFATFAHKLTGVYPEEVTHCRYKAFMPTFDPDNQECVSRGDKESIPGYGNILIINLPKK
ncbi:MAG TPA: hypothetical protein VGP47_11900 [Parachlamydiaceae bacterium]|nr:hypothetical protein [Parachlamydiaceae bacterium]